MAPHREARHKPARKEGMTALGRLPAAARAERQETQRAARVRTLSERSDAGSEARARRGGEHGAVCAGGVDVGLFFVRRLGCF